MPSDLFTQPAPRLGNQYTDDRVLRSYLRRTLPPAVLSKIEPELTAMGVLAGGELYDLQLADRLNEPRLTQWDAWGERVDRVELTPVWRRAAEIAARSGLVAIPYEAAHGRFSRLHQMALVHLFHPSTDVYTCPLAMSDGAARALVVSGNPGLRDRALPRLISRDPDDAWTSGQWMTETAGGSDVGRTGTVARRDPGGAGEERGERTWRLYGRKWFTSAVTSQMALTLARPEGAPPGARGLALFYVEVFGADGRPNRLQVLRLKDKLGTRKLPTAELLLDGTPALPVAGLDGGVRAIAPMLNVTRLWNAVSSVSFMRRGIALARDYAGRREAFGARLLDQPLHADTLAGLQAEYEGAFHLTFRLAELLGAEEAGEGSAEEALLLRALTPIVKATTAKQVVAVASEVLEAFGGAGYVEDTGLPALLRDAQVLPIWEGTTNVLALDLLRALRTDGAFEAVAGEVARCRSGLEEPGLVAVGERAAAAVQAAGGWLARAAAESQTAAEAGARRFALTLGRALEVALLAAHAQNALDHENDARPRAATLRLAARPPGGLDLLADVDPLHSAALAADAPLPAAHLHAAGDARYASESSEAGDAGDARYASESSEAGDAGDAGDRLRPR